MYTWRFTLRKTGLDSWTLYSDKEKEMVTFSNCASKEDALDRARVYCSSWNSVSIKVEDEANKKTD
jgi:hypothetical protein